MSLCNILKPVLLSIHHRNYIAKKIKVTTCVSHNMIVIMQSANTKTFL